MKDEYGRVNDRKQAIQSMNREDLARLLQDIKENQMRYPKSSDGWQVWLMEDSGESIEEF